MQRLPEPRIAIAAKFTAETVFRSLSFWFEKPRLPFGIEFPYKVAAPPSTLIAGIASRFSGRDQ